MPLPQISDADITALLEALNAGLADGERLVLDASRRAAIRNCTDIHACPGGGKTSLVGLKLILLAQKWLDRYCGICVLTHTNVAKNEILKCVRGHSAGAKLLSYPHFIGTIQDFVHSFLALPACRSSGRPVRRVDDSVCTSIQDGKISHGTRSYLNNRHASIADLRVVCINGKLEISVPGFADKSESDSYKDLEAAKRHALKNGYFFFSEMYALGDSLLHENPSVADALRRRFPLVLLDEMQDAQKFQDDLVNRLFRNGDTSIQRFGDPDQAIFDGMGGEEPNETYNAAALAPIADSYRFTPVIADKLRGLSTRGIALVGTRPMVPATPSCTIILYDDANIGRVLDRFGKIIAALHPNQRVIIKAIGGVAHNAPEAKHPLNIQSYWPAFERARAPKSFAPNSFCDAVRHCAELEEGNVQQRHGVLLQSVIELLRLAEKTNVNRAGQATGVTVANLSRFLRASGKETELRMLLAEVHMRTMPSRAIWATYCERLRLCCGIEPDNAGVIPYLEFAELAAQHVAPEVGPGNIYASPSGISIEVSTIHAVKGETHDATLVLETKYQKLHDVTAMLPYLIDENAARPVFDPQHPQTHASIKAGFMKKLYVAASRARHVVCIAMHKDRISADQRTRLQDQKAWSIVEL